MSFRKKLIQKIKYKAYIYFYKNKKFATEEEFYTYLFTKNPSWSSIDGNEEEIIRWGEIKVELERYKTNDSTLSILEIGCGRGWLCKKLTSYGKVTGIEPIKPVVEFAKKKFPKITFFNGVSTTFIEKFPDNKFDLIISTEVLEHVKDKALFINSVNKLLKPNGIIILTTPRLEHYQDYVKAFGSDPNQPIEDWVSEIQLRLLFENNGFSILNKRFFSPLTNNNITVYITQLWVCKKND